VAAYTEHSGDRGFALLRRQAGRINQMMDSAGYAERRSDAIIAREELATLLSPTEPLPDWAALARAMARKYDGATADRIVATAQAQRWTELERLYSEPTSPSVRSLVLIERADYPRGNCTTRVPIRAAARS
jgi:hypothetical protein